MSFLFADVRGSTTIAESMAPAEFGALMNRFYAVASEALITHGAFIDKLVGDEVVSYFLPCFTGADTASAAVAAARELLDAAHSDERVTVGIGVHTGAAYFGTVTAADGAFSDLTALGDSVNVAARLASRAKAGEAVVSRACWDAASGDKPKPKSTRKLRLKGRGEPIDVVVLSATQRDREPSTPSP